MKKDFLACLIFCFAFSFLLLSSESRGEWFKGNLHMHSLWSDGKVFPEEAMQWYIERGYQFVSLTDHSFLQRDTARWVRVDERVLARYRAAFPDAICIRENEKGETEVRLKTVDELQTQFNRDGKFLVIPGFELTHFMPSHAIHMNAIGVQETSPYQHGATIAETVQKNIAQVKNLAKDMPVIFMLNHPTWRYFDVSPQDILDVPELRFFELNNGGPALPVEDFPDKDKFWDVVNAFRAARGEQLIFGVGSDDNHNYAPREAFAWIVVDADSLTMPAIFAAMNTGKFYTSTGVKLKSLTQDAQTKTLSLEIDADEGVDYQIEFIGTRRGFSTDVTTKQITPTAQSDGTPLRSDPNLWTRTATRYSDEIGCVLQTVNGTRGAYTLTADDLYIRARITSTRETLQNRDHLDSPFERAWTQPFAP